MLYVLQSLIRRFSNAAADLERLKETTAKLEVKYPGKKHPHELKTVSTLEQ